MTPSPPRRARRRREPRRTAYCDDAQRELQLERLDRRVQRVRHRHVHPAGAVGVVARALAAAERLVVGEASLPRVRLFIVPWPSAWPKAREHEVRDARGGLDVAAGHGGRRARVEQRAGLGAITSPAGTRRRSAECRGR